MKYKKNKHIFHGVASYSVFFLPLSILNRNGGKPVAVLNRCVIYLTDRNICYFKKRGRRPLIEVKTTRIGA